MFSQIYSYIYSQPLDRLAGFSIAIIFEWTILMCFLKRDFKLFKSLNKFCTVAAFVAILCATILNRNSGTSSKVVLLPLSSLSQERFSADLCKECIMNVLLFLPLGIFMPYAMPQSRKNKVILTIMFGMSVSICVEMIQGILGIGWFETDDIINNTLGVVVGSRSYAAFEKIPKFTGALNDIKKRVFFFYRDNLTDKMSGGL